MHAHDGHLKKILADVPPLPNTLFMAVRAGIDKKAQTRQRVLIAAALLAIAVITPILIVPAQLTRVTAASPQNKIDTAGIDDVLTDAGSLFNEDISLDEDFLAIAIDNMEE